jgi:acetyl esterase/lipase
MRLLLLIVPSLILFGQEQAYQPVDVPEEYTASLDVVYSTVGDWNGRMDIYRPKDPASATPAVLNVHGGAWAHGVKESQRGFGSFFKHGWAVVNVEYRMAPVAPAPAAIEDVRCALIYVIHHAKELGIDPARIVMMGGSAGGHLALMAGLLGNDHRFDTNCPTTQPVALAAIVDKYGIVTFDGLGSLKRGRSVTTWLRENYDNENFLRSISPITYVTRNSPPVFIVHGDADPTVPYTQSVHLHRTLDSLGVVNEFITVEGGQHGKFSKEKNSEISAAMWRFFERIGLLR